MKIFARPVSLPLLVALVLSVVIWLLVITVAPVSGEITPLPLPVFSTDQHDGIELIENGSFEAKDSNGLPVLAGWTLTHPTHDKIKCSKPDQTSISHSGNCAFRFRGSIGEKAGLFQAPPLNGITLSSGDQLVFKAYIKMSISACFTIRIQVMNDRNRQKFHKTIRPLDVGGDASAVIGDDYQHFSSLVTLTIPANYVSFKFINKSVMGKTLLDDVSIMYYPASTGMYPALIP